MVWWSKQQAHINNQQAANLRIQRGGMSSLGTYLCASENPRPFMVSGGGLSGRRYQVIYDLLTTWMGKYPIVILHNHNEALMGTVVKVLKEHREEMKNRDIWLLDEEHPLYEPFYGMDEMEITDIIRQMARQLDYTVSARLEDIVHAHLRILEELEVEVSLTGLRYLCDFKDQGAFHDNIMELPCGESEARQIWSDLAQNTEEGKTQLSLFRAVIKHLAQSASKNGWSEENRIDECSCRGIMQSKGVLALPVDDAYSELFFTYLANELKAVRTPYLLLIDDVRITNEELYSYLTMPASRACCGLISANVLDMVQGDAEKLKRLAGKMNTFLLFKHTTASTAEVLSEILGKYDHSKVEVAEGVQREFMDFLPRGKHEELHIGIENRYRVMPEMFMDLNDEQAIVFDTGSNQIIQVNG